MNTQEVYSQLHGNYKDAKSRLMTDKLIEKFLLKFLNDPTYQQLLDAVAANNIEESFRAAHTLKGVAANLGFTELKQNASALTEQLRDRQNTADEQLLSAVSASYKLVIDTINSNKL